MRNNSPPAICIFGKNIDPAIRGVGTFGGAELQMALIAKTLAMHGIPVKIVDTELRESYSHQTNLDMEAIPGWGRGIRGVRLFSHRIPNLIRCLRAIDAKVYYVSGFSFLHLLALAAKRRSATFILAVASDTDLMRFRDRYKTMYRKNASVWTWLSTIIPNEIASSTILECADILLVQHDIQQDLARSRGKCVMKLNNILGDDVLQIKSRSRRNCIIVGGLSAIKGLRSLLLIIREVQQVVFEFVGEPRDNEGESVKHELQQYPNVILHGALDRHTTLEKIAGAKVLLNTSRAEGFPNTFLEAWALGTPVISLFVDPGGVIASNHLGYVCNGDLRKFKDLVLIDKYNIDEARIREYVLRHHMADQALRFFQRILDNKVPLASDGLS